MLHKPTDLTVLGSSFTLCFLGLCFVGHPAWLTFLTVAVSVAFFASLLWHESHDPHEMRHA